MLCCIWTLLCWNLFLLGVRRCGHPLRQLAHYKLKKKKKAKQPTPPNEQFVQSELSTSEDTSLSLSLAKFGRVAVGVTKTQKEGTDGHLHAIIHVLMSCVPLLWLKLSSLLNLSCMGNGGFSSGCSWSCVFFSHRRWAMSRACFWLLGFWLQRAQFWPCF